MINHLDCYQKVKKKCFSFINLQETKKEKFKNKEKMIKSFLIPICFWINKNKPQNKTFIIGLDGGQGTGKTTISSLIRLILTTYFKLNVFKVSIDDFYRTRKERIKLSKSKHPLLLTRGVPGTHDVDMMNKLFSNVKKKTFNSMVIPKFDKSIDDRSSKNKWIKVNKKPNVVIFEGWCVGVTPQKKKDLIDPINKLEKEKDKKRIWRSRVNKELIEKYQKIFNLIDKLIFLKVPSFKYVFKWRLLQEKKLRIISKGKKTMSDEEVKNFTMFYERLTKHMLNNLYRKTDTVINIDTKHRLKSIKFN